MRDRLQKFMDAEHLQASRLAEILGVQPATISHILNGRNRPSFEFIEKLLQRFPKINPDWLLLGKGGLYRSDMIQQQPYREPQFTAENTQQNIDTMQKTPVASTPDLFSESLLRTEFKDTEKKENLISDGQNRNTWTENFSTKSNLQKPVSEKKSETEMSQISDSDIERIVIFLKNGTCVSYKPR